MAYHTTAINECQEIKICVFYNNRREKRIFREYIHKYEYFSFEKNQNNELKLVKKHKKSGFLYKINKKSIKYRQHLYEKELNNY